MLINEVCKECNLTKKAVEYYTEQGLIQPRITEKRVSAVLRDRCFEAQANCSFAWTGLFRSKDSHNS